MATGADLITAALAAAGIDTCFANPGTSEVDLVGALDRSSIRSVLALHENVATGAADGYARIAGRPAMALLHLGPGLANGLANLHNARRARSPLVAVVGQHPTWHLDADSPLASDIAALAGVVSGWVRQCASAATIGEDVVEAVGSAAGPPAGVATLVVPMDLQRAAATGAPAQPVSPRRSPSPDDADVDRAVARLRAGRGTVLHIGGDALTAYGLRLTRRLEAALGCRILTEPFPARIDRGEGIPWFPTIPYFAEDALPALADVTTCVLVGAPPPVFMFGGPDRRSSPLPPHAEVFDIGGASPAATLEALVAAVGAPPVTTASPVVAAVSGSLDGHTAGATVARHLPDECIVIDESGTAGAGYQVAAPASARHIRLGVTGGAIGTGLPLAVGASMASPEQRVVALQADGSGMYTVQALWTMARESLDITVVVLSNGRYAILETEFARAGMHPLGRTATSLTDLSRPALDWVRLAEGHGVPARRATTVDELSETLAQSIDTPGPTLIEAML